MNDTANTDDALRIAWEGEIVGGVIASGLWVPVVREESLRFPSALWQLDSDPLESRHYGPCCEVVQWRVRLSAWPSADDWESLLETTLEGITRQGAALAWFAEEGYVEDPTHLFEPGSTNPGVYAAYIPDSGFLTTAALRSPFRTFDESQLARLRNALPPLLTTDEGERKAWVTDDTERLSREEALQQLVGPRIEAVRYVEGGFPEEVGGPPAGDQKPMWQGPIFDSLDFGLELDLDTGVTWSFIWEKNLKSRSDGGLLAYEGTLTPWELCPGAHIATWDVTEHWRERGPAEIATVTPVWRRAYSSIGWSRSRVTTFWKRFRAGGRKWTAWHPKIRSFDTTLETIILGSKTGREAVITLGERVDGYERNYLGSYDNVAVFFSSSDARHHGVLMPGDADAAP